MILMFIAARHTCASCVPKSLNQHKDRERDSRRAKKILCKSTHPKNCNAYCILESIHHLPHDCMRAYVSRFLCIRGWKSLSGRHITGFQQINNTQCGSADQQQCTYARTRWWVDTRTDTHTHPIHPRAYHSIRSHSLIPRIFATQMQFPIQIQMLPARYQSTATQSSTATIYRRTPMQTDP